MSKLTKKRIGIALVDADLEGKDRWVADGDGLFARCTPAGRVYLVYQYWLGGRGGRPKRVTLGRLGEILADGTELTIAKGRALAAIERGKVKAGQDPAAERQLESDKRKGKTFADAWEGYSEGEGGENRSWPETDRLVRFDAWEALGARPMATLRREHVAELIDRVKRRSPSVARALFAALRPFFVWAVERRLVEQSPCDGLRAPKPMEARDRVLNTDELHALFVAIGGLGFPWQHIYRLLVLTLARREEIAGLMWSELDLDAGVWTLPAKRSKNGKEHITDLPPQAVEILRTLPKNYELVFTTTGTTAPSGFSKAKKQLDAAMEAQLGLETGKITRWRTHDIRRTVATTLAEDFGIEEGVIERLLNHQKQGMKRVYQRQTYREQRKQALILWANHIERHLTASNIAPITQNVDTNSGNVRQRCV